MLDWPLKTPLNAKYAKPAVARTFQPPAVALEEEAPPRGLIWVLLAMTALLLAAILWSALARVDEIVMARGELESTVPTLVIQPIDTVMVKAINVKVGDVVHKGDVLASLDPTFAEADVEQLRTKLASYSAREARLEAELDHKDYVATPSQSADEMLEASLFEERKLQYASRMRAFAEDIARFEASLGSTYDELKKSAKQAELLQQVVDMRQKLVASALDSQQRLIETQVELVQSEQKIVEARGQVAEFRYKLESTAAERDAFAQEWRAKIADELVTVRRDREAAAEDYRKALRRRDMVSLTAPGDAIVLEIARRSVGSVLREAEPLFRLAPLDAPLKAEVSISPRDIGRIHVGDEVRIKLDAFPFQRHGTLAGRIETISADAFHPGNASDALNPPSPNGAQAQPFYRTRIKLLSTRLLNMTEEARLLPGMSATGEIKVGRRRVISYLLYPIMNGLDESLREP